MAVIFRSVGTAFLGGGSSVQVVVNNVQVGDKLIAACTFWADTSGLSTIASISDGANTWRSDISTTGPTISTGGDGSAACIWSADATVAGTVTVTINTNGFSYGNASVSTFGGVTAGNSLDASGGAFRSRDQSSVNVAVSTSGATTQAGDLVVALNFPTLTDGNAGVNAVYTQPTGSANLTRVSTGDKFSVEAFVAASTGVQSADWGNMVTNSPGAVDINWTTVIAAYKTTQQSAGTYTDTVAVSGPQIWFTPPTVTAFTPETWGGGGSGGRQTRATGGGGGAYSKTNSVTVSAGTPVFISVGAGGTAVGSAATTVGVAGGDTWVNAASKAAPTLVSQGALAKGGGAGQISNTTTLAVAGAGGLSSAGVGDTKFSGGSSGTAGTATASASGGGGAATLSSVGGNSANTASGAISAGAAAGTGGAAATAATSGTTGNNNVAGGGGGAGSNTASVNGGAGGAPGGGGGGRSSSTTAGASGAGARGQVTIAYTVTSVTLRRIHLI